MHSITIELIQRACQAEGLYAGPIDGQRSPELEEAKRRFDEKWEEEPPVVEVDHKEN